MAPYFGVVLNAVNWTFTSLAAVFLSLRVYCKISRGRGLWWDDYILIAAFVTAVGAVGFVTSSIMLGFANPSVTPSPAAARQLQIHGGVQNVLFSLASDLSKTSFGFTLLRVTEGRVKQLVIFLIATLNIVYFLVIIFTFLKCTPAIYCWLPPDTCWSLWTYIKFAIFSGAYSAFVDFIFAIIPWFLVKDLNMKKAEKLGVAIAMSFGAIAGITAVIRAIFLPYLASPDFSTKATTLVIWYTAEADTTIIAASIPVLRALIKEIQTSGARYFSGEKYASGAHDGSDAKGTARSNTKGKGFGSKKKESALHTSRVVTTVTGHRPKYPSDGDMGSDKSILEAPAEPGKIVQTQEVRLSYHDRSDNDSMGYEMDVMGRRSS
ncbi:hypothetical protein NUW58_g2940 [Xylaria curta]|uniref:Uncharacterized protein n=1 Tax=Xylaria curta TaxID=42375 RepID=A0ACC1PEK6_9PEZI|nr:hypothetical protein NUW58_g2940 [Xylaria curta]